MKKISLLILTIISILNIQNLKAEDNNMYLSCDNNIIMVNIDGIDEQVILAGIDNNIITENICTLINNNDEISYLKESDGSSFLYIGDNLINATILENGWSKYVRTNNINQNKELCKAELEAYKTSTGVWTNTELKTACEESDYKTEDETKYVMENSEEISRVWGVKESIGTKILRYFLLGIVIFFIVIFKIKKTSK